MIVSSFNASGQFLHPVYLETLGRQAQLQCGELGAAGCEVGTGIVKALDRGAEQLFLVWTEHKNLEYIYRVKRLNSG